MRRLVSPSPAAAIAAKPPSASPARGPNTSANQPTAGAPMVEPADLEGDEGIAAEALQSERDVGHWDKYPYHAALLILELLGAMSIYCDPSRYSRCIIFQCLQEADMLEQRKIKGLTKVDFRPFKPWTVFIALLCLCILSEGCALKTATVYALLDLGKGGSGFAATLYAQEVASGKTVHVFQSAGSHGLVVLPTSAPLAIVLDAPGTYVFYARLINEPDSYHFGATGCLAGENCQNSELLALQVAPGGVYNVVITDRKALLPEVGQPVTVPWRLP